MLKSMTGYGKGAAADGCRQAVVEIKSVNHRYNETAIRLPRFLNCFEERFRAKVADAASRGKIEVFVKYDPGRGAGLAVNKPLAEAYAYSLLELKASLPAGFTDDLSVSLIARLPDVFDAAKDDMEGEDGEAVWDVLERALGAALSQFGEMKEREGEKLSYDLLNKAEEIGRLAGKAQSRAPFVAKNYREKLAARIREALSGAQYDETRILTEAAIYADKTSIDEEVTRLFSHLSQFCSIINSGGAVGKKLDFLIQELNREANTIASKANDLDLSRTALDIKGEIEKMREQVQNIE